MGSHCNPRASSCCTGFACAPSATDPNDGVCMEVCAAANSSCTTGVEDDCCEGLTCAEMSPGVPGPNTGLCMALADELQAVCNPVGGMCATALKDCCQGAVCAPTRDNPDLGVCLRQAVFSETELQREEDPGN